MATTTLVIDIGGSDLKASVLDDAGAMLTERVVHPTRYPCGGNTRKIVGPLSPDVTMVGPNAALLAGVKLWAASR